MRQSRQLTVERSHQGIAARLIHLTAAADVALKSAGADDSLRGRIEDELKKKNTQ